jgi:hypothetical protein
VYLTESDPAPCGKLEPLAVLSTNTDGGGIVQAVGPLKTLTPGANSALARRYPLISKSNDASGAVLTQSADKGH